MILGLSKNQFFKVKQCPRKIDLQRSTLFDQSDLLILSRHLNILKNFFLNFKFILTLSE